MGARVLAVDDDPEYLEWIKRVLSARGHSCDTASTAKQALERLSHSSPDIVLLDEHLPDGLGTELCSQIRRLSTQVRLLVVILTGHRATVESDSWLEAGADTCWPKTFKSVRLAAMVEGLVRRQHWDAGTAEKKLPNIDVDLVHRVVSFRGDASVPLSAREFALLQLLLERHPAAVPRDVIRDHVFSKSSAEQLDLAINEFMRRLRKKLPASLSAAVVAVHGLGYRLEV